MLDGISLATILDNGLTATVLVGVFFLALWRGWIHTGGEFNRMVTAFSDRVADLKTFYETRLEDKQIAYEARLADKQAVTDEKSRTINAQYEIVTEQSKQISDLVRATETTEHLIEALQEAAQLGGSNDRQ